MTPSDDLFLLIQSLSKSEKRYFKMFASFQSGNKNYLKLFDAIDKQKEYDEKAIKKIFGKQNFIKYLPAEKKYLFRLIMKSLKNYHTDLSAQYRMRELLKEAEILHKRNLHKLAEKTLKKARKIGEKHDLIPSLMESAWLEFELKRLQVDFKALKEHSKGYFEEDKKLLDLYQNKQEYFKMVVDAYTLSRSMSNSTDLKYLKAYQKMYDGKLMQDFSSAKSLVSQYYFYNIKYLYHQQFGNKEKAKDYCAKIMSLLESDDEILKENLYRYIATVRNYASACLVLGQGDELERVYEKVRALVLSQPSSISAPLIDLYHSTAVIGLEHMFDNGMLDEGLNFVAKMEPVLLEDEQNINEHSEHILSAYYSLACIYFLNNDFSKALKWLNKIISIRSEIRMDLLVSSRLLVILTHYEMRNYDLLEYLIKSLTRYLTKENRFFEPEKILLKYYKWLASMPSSKELAIESKNVYNKLLPLKVDPVEGRALQLFDHLAWLKSKITKDSFKEILASAKKS